MGEEDCMHTQGAQSSAKTSIIKAQWAPLVITFDAKSPEKNRRPDLR